MSIFGKIAEAIFGSPAHADTPPSGTPPAAPSPVQAPMADQARVAAAAPQASTEPPKAAARQAPDAASAPPVAKPAGTSPAPMKAAQSVDIAVVLDRMLDDADEDLDWRKSIVDLMKLLKLDSSLKARKTLATELGYGGNMSDSAAMNVWLHKQVMTKLAENGGKVPAGLTH